MISVIRVLGWLICLCTMYMWFQNQGANPPMAPYVGLFFLGMALAALPDNFKLTSSTFIGWILLFTSIYLLILGLGYDFIENIKIPIELGKVFAGFILYFIFGKLLGLEFSFGVNNNDDNF